MKVRHGEQIAGLSGGLQKLVPREEENTEVVGRPSVK